jgi:hypothetical protein
MLVNAAQFPGPALWQGIMFLVMPIALILMFIREGRYAKYAIGGYVVFGVVITGLIRAWFAQ